jgi:hypothetical protein
MPIDVNKNELEETLLKLEKKIKRETGKKQKEKYVKLYQQGLFLKFVLIDVGSKINELDIEYVKFEMKNVLIYCDKVSNYLKVA